MCDIFFPSDVITSLSLALIYINCEYMCCIPSIIQDLPFISLIPTVLYTSGKFLFINLYNPSTPINYFIYNII